MSVFTLDKNSFRQTHRPRDRQTDEQVHALLKSAVKGLWLHKMYNYMTPKLSHLELFYSN